MMLLSENSKIVLKRPLLNRDKRKNLAQFKAILAQANNAKITVAIDWLSVNFVCPEEAIKEPPDPELDFTEQINENLILQYKGKGNKHFKYIWSVVYKQEKVADILTHTRNQKFVKKGIVKVDFKNHLFYNAEVWPVYDLMVSSLQLKVKSVSRIDIAFDGANYLCDFFNLYFKQSSRNKVVEMKGRAKLRADVYDRQQMKYEAFKIGKGNDTKTVTVYNKSLDIVKTGKEYIQVFWKKNGVLTEVLPFAEYRRMPDKEKDLRQYLEGYENIYRFEFRFGSEAIRDIDGFSIDKARDINYLVSIVKLHTRLFFDAVWLDNERIERCSPIELIPFERFEIVPLQKVKLTPTDDLYKAKQSLHLMVKEIFKGVLSPEEYENRERILNHLSYYRLEKYFIKKIGEWHSDYKFLNPDLKYVRNVEQFFADLIKDVDLKTEINEYQTY